jgi:predicted transposase/invertase (TIGR01784 family)
MDKRTLFYWSKIFTEQLKEGQPFQELKKTIAINILDFNYIEVDSYHTVFHLREDSHKDYKLTDVLEIRFLELPKFRKAKPDLGKPLDRWLLFIEDSPEEVLQMVMKEDPTIAKAEEIVEYLGSLDEIRRYYEAREMAIHDEITRITGAKEEGIAQEKLDAARKMLIKNTDEQFIADVTGLSLEQIQKLKTEIAGEAH